MSLSLKPHTHFCHFVLSWSNISFTCWQKLFWQLAWNNPRGGWNKKGVSQTVMLMHGVQIALSTERWKYRDTHTHRGHPSMPLQEMGSVLLGVYWWGVFEKSCVCSRSGQQVWKLPNRAPALFCYYIFLGTWRGSRWARCSERPSAGLCFIWVIAGLRLRIRFIIIFLSNLQLGTPDIWWSPLVGCALSPF